MSAPEDYDKTGGRIYYQGVVIRHGVGNAAVFTIYEKIRLHAFKIGGQGYLASSEDVFRNL